MFYQIGDNLCFKTLGRFAIVLPSLIFIHFKLGEAYKVNFTACDCTPLGFTLID
jgi:hypothetical protein